MEYAPGTLGLPTQEPTPQTLPGYQADTNWGRGMSQPSTLQSLGTGQPMHTEQSLNNFVSRLAPNLRNLEDAQRYSPLGIDPAMFWNRVYGGQAQPQVQNDQPLAQIAQPPLAALATPQPPPSYSPMPPIQGEGWYTDPNSPAAQWTGAGNIANTPQATSENWVSPGNPPPATSENWGQTGMGNTGRIYS